MNGFKRDGYYLEVGAFESYTTSNTYVLEKLGWTGISYEIRPECVQQFNNNRTNVCYCEDATAANYGERLDELKAPARIDYLQLDIEPANNTLTALKRMPLDRYRFTVITFEHDLYINPTTNLEVKNAARDLLTSHGYLLICENVKHNGNRFEDWYVDATFVPEEIYRPAICSDVEGREIFNGSPLRLVDLEVS